MFEQIINTMVNVYLEYCNTRTCVSKMHADSCHAFHLKKKKLPLIPEAGPHTNYVGGVSDLTNNRRV